MAWLKYPKASTWKFVSNSQTFLIYFLYHRISSWLVLSSTKELVQKFRKERALPWMKLGSNLQVRSKPGNWQSSSWWKFYCLVSLQNNFFWTSCRCSLNYQCWIVIQTSLTQAPSLACSEEVLPWNQFSQSFHKDSNRCLARMTLKRLHRIQCIILSFLQLTGTVRFLF